MLMPAASPTDLCARFRLSHGDELFGSAAITTQLMSVDGSKFMKDMTVEMSLGSAFRKHAMISVTCPVSRERPRTEKVCCVVMVKDGY